MSLNGLHRFHPAASSDCISHSTPDYAPPAIGPTPLWRKLIAWFHKPSVPSGNPGTR